MSKLFGAGGGVIKIFARGGVIKNFFRVGLEGGRQNFFIADFGVLGQKLVPAPAGKIFFSSRIFFLKKKNLASLKSSKSGVGGQKPFLRGWGWF